MRRLAGPLAAAVAALAGPGGGCRDDREAVAAEIRELEQQQRRVTEQLGPDASPDRRREATEALREEHRDVAEAIDDLHRGREEGGPIAGTDVVRGEVTAVSPDGVRLRVADRELVLALPPGAEIQASNGHELGREYVVPGAEVRAVYHGAETPSPQIDELWVVTVPGQEGLPTNAPLTPKVPTPPANEGDRQPPALPSGDPGGRVR